MTADGLKAAEDKMRAAGQDEAAVRAFARAYERLTGGDSGLTASADLEPVTDVAVLDALDAPSAQAASDILGRTAVIKLNGGLATTMGLRRPKSLMEARDGHSFLDLIVGQTLAIRTRYGVGTPLLLMDSEATQADTLDALKAYPELADQPVPIDFLQSMIPKLDAETMQPVSWSPEPALEWCPPGHGDVYGALKRSGTLATLLENGFDYAMIANADNLGATLDPRIANFLASERVPFLMEVIEGTEAERKAGHIARRRSDGQLILREVAQTPPEDMDSFRDYRRWRYYNTNNLWVDLHALSNALDQAGGVLELPLIVNRKTVDPRDGDSPKVLQLESAMGAAIGLFEGARVLQVPRTRFAPVKTTDDLLVLRSDVYRVSEEDSVVKPVPERADRLPFVELDPRYYKLLDEFEKRFPDGAPSLVNADRLVVRGDVTFGAGVVVRGAVQLEADAPRSIEPGTVLDWS
jgi:UTP--glucose-1-phosphate uridylyltransferase